MQITQNFLDSLPFQGGFELETIEDNTFLVIKNQKYCKLFWMHFWKEILQPKFAAQTNITRLSDGDITIKVIIDKETGNLLGTPAAWNTIFYYGNYEITNPPFRIPLGGIWVLVIYILCLVLVFVVASRTRSVASQI